MKAVFTPDRTTKIIIFGIGAAVLLIVLVRSHQSRRPNACPIDGRQAEWTNPRNGTTCEYRHFSEVERTTHSKLTLQGERRSRGKLARPKYHRKT